MDPDRLNKLLATGNFMSSESGDGLLIWRYERI